MSRSRLALLLVLFLALPLPALAAAPIGFVDMQKVLEDSKLGQQLQDDLRVEFEPRAKTLAEEEAAIRELQQALERDGALMSNDQVKKAEGEIQTRIKDYQEKGNDLQQDLMKVQQAKSREIIQPARDSINAVAKKRGLGMVIEPGMSGLLYIDDALDITGDVVKHLDSKTK